MAASKSNGTPGRGRQATKALELMLKYFEENGDSIIIWKDVEVASGIKPLMRMWEHQVRSAVFDGDKQALDMIVNRLDGKPRQAVDLGGQDDNPVKTESTFNFIPVNNKD